MYCFISPGRACNLSVFRTFIVEGSSMAQARTPVRVMYACGLVVAGSVLFLMIYSGMLEGVGEAIFDLVKEIVKSFIS